MSNNKDLTINKPNINKININLINEKTIDTNILNLKIISQIKENDKLCANKNIITIDKPNIVQSFSRWYNREGRMLTIEKLNNICTITFMITEKLLKEEKDKKENNKELKNIDLDDTNNQIFQSLVHEMTNSLKGLTNLKKTYSQDILISSQIDLLINKMTNRIEKINKLFRLNI